MHNPVNPTMRKVKMSENHHHDHGHNHAHHHDLTEKRLMISVGLNLMITLAEVIGGLISGSLALLSDAVHNLSDSGSLALSLIVHRISRRQPDQRKTFGYKRAETIGALINLVTLIVIALFLLKEGVERFFQPQPIEGLTMFVVAIVGLLGNVITAVLLFQSAKDNLNIRSSFYHILSDGLSSVGVILAGILILKYRLYIVDTLLTIVIAGYILVQSYGLLKQTINLLMDSAPDGFELDHLEREIKAIARVRDIHHIHVWQSDEASTCLEAHIVVDPADLSQMEAIKDQIKHVLTDHFHIQHSSLEFETGVCANLTH